MKPQLQTTLKRLAGALGGTVQPLSRRSVGPRCPFTRLPYVRAATRGHPV